MTDENREGPGIEELLPAVEALLFSSGKPVHEKEMALLLEESPARVGEALERLAESTNAACRGIRLERVGGGWRFVTRPEHDGLLRKFFEVSERSRLSLAALETLAIVAYRQPITAPEISDLRNVNSSGVLKTLFDKKLITTAGRKPVVGTPFFYKTTPDFLVRFGLNDLSELPKPEELDAELSAGGEGVNAGELAAPLPTSGTAGSGEFSPGAGEPAAANATAGVSDEESVPAPTE